MLCDKAMRALKAGDYPRAASILIKAKDTCNTYCNDYTLCKTIDYALNEVIDGEYDLAMKFLRKAWDICGQIKE